MRLLFQFYLGFSFLLICACPPNPCFDPEEVGYFEIEKIDSDTVQATPIRIKCPNNTPCIITISGLSSGVMEQGCPWIFSWVFPEDDKKYHRQNDGFKKENDGNPWWSERVRLGGDDTFVPLSGQRFKLVTIVTDDPQKVRGIDTISNLAELRVNFAQSSEIWVEVE